MTAASTAAWTENHAEPGTKNLFHPSLTGIFPALAWPRWSDGYHDTAPDSAQLNRLQAGKKTAEERRPDRN